jgi:hypothetical protein
MLHKHANRRTQNKSDNIPHDVGNAEKNRGKFHRGSAEDEEDNCQNTAGASGGSTA